MMNWKWSSELERIKRSKDDDSGRLFCVGREWIEYQTFVETGGLSTVKTWKKKNHRHQNSRKNEKDEGPSFHHSSLLSAECSLEDIGPPSTKHHLSSFAVRRSRNVQLVAGPGPMRRKRGYSDSPSPISQLVYNRRFLLICNVRPQYISSSFSCLLFLFYESRPITTPPN